MWSTKYRCKGLFGDIRLRLRDIVRQVWAANGVGITQCVLSGGHGHMVVSVLPKLAVSEPRITIERFQHPRPEPGRGRYACQISFIRRSAS